VSTDMILTGYRFSVYTRAVRMAYRECDPFDPVQAGQLAALNPFGRVPVLQHGAFRLWETQAILDYIDEVLDGPALVPDGAKARARLRQVMGIVDSDLYWPLVRQAFSHGVFQPRMGEPGDDAELKAGLARAPRVLDSLEEIAAEGYVLVPGQMTLADCQLWPMLDYFSMVSEGQRMIADRPALGLWAVAIAATTAARETKPAIPGDTTRGKA